VLRDRGAIRLSAGNAGNMSGETMETCKTEQETVQSAPGSNATFRAESNALPPDGDAHHTLMATRLVIWLAAGFSGIDAAEIRAPRKRRREVQQIRRIVIYLLHTWFRIPYGELARLLHCNRTTVAAACHAVEDLREDQERDSEISRLEQLAELAASLANAGIFPRAGVR
jgi:hypothetical protein